MPKKNNVKRKRKKPMTPVREFRIFKDRIHKMVDKTRMVRDGNTYRFLIDPSLIEFIFRITAQAQTEIKKRATQENAQKLKELLKKQPGDE